jgi:hypothetical protein
MMSDWYIDEENNRILVDDERQTIVCLMAGSIRNSEVMDDAHKIAAAPDMLAALKMARNWLDGRASAATELSIIDAAIARAEGWRG